MPEPRALGGGRAAEDYEHGRPGWPDEVVDPLVRELALDRGAHVVDLAAGTGKLTRQLVTRFACVYAVEPDERMRALLDKTAPTAVSSAGFGEDIPLPDSCADAVFCAEAFHWFDAAAALAEIERVLRPEGGLALLWSPRWDFDPPIPAAVEARLDQVYEQSGPPGSAKFDTGDWKEALPGSGFGPIQQTVVEHETEVDRDQVVSLTLSISSVAALEREERDELAAFLRRELAPTYRMPIVTELYWTRLTP